MKKNLVLILAGGSGSRIAGQLPKQFLPLDGKPILLHTIDRFQKHPSIHHIIIVTNGEFLQNTEDILDRQRNTAGTAYNKVMRVLTGGKTRQDSSRIGVMAADPEIYGNILIHDAARPFISKKIIDDILEKLETYSAVNLAIPSADTILEIDE
ncbi:MAG: NTP transferase domain-containing protein, partial [bacterium]|nr:NTP transferase domain-containing protein [bacterium]